MYYHYYYLKNQYITITIASLVNVTITMKYDREHQYIAITIASLEI